MKYGLRRFFCNLEGQFKSGCTQFWDAVVDAKQPRHKETLSGVKVSRARLMNEAESRKKEVTPVTFTAKKVKTYLMRRLPRASRQSQPARSRWIMA